MGKRADTPGRVRRGGFHTSGNGEAISDARDCFDQHFFISPTPQGLTDFSDRRRQGGFDHGQTRPDLVQQLVLRHGVPGLKQEFVQKVHGLGFERGPAPGYDQCPAAFIEHSVTEEPASALTTICEHLRVFGAHRNLQQSLRTPL